MRILAMLWLISLGAFAAEEEEKKKHWSNSTELSAVQTDGNSESSSLGLVNQYAYEKGKGKFTWNVLAIRVETTTTSITATGTPENPVFESTKDTATATENYRNDLKYEYAFAKRTSWFVGGTWEQDEPKGIADRTQVVLGVANTWIDTDKTKFSTNYGVGYNKEDLLATGEQDFMTGELGFEWVVQLKNGQFDQTFKGDVNQDETEDWRIRLENGLLFNLTDRLAFKTSLNLEYNNLPNFINVDLGDTGQQAAYQLDEMDTQLTISLVIGL